MDNQDRGTLESLADQLESVARGISREAHQQEGMLDPDDVEHEKGIASQLFTLAWRVKQIARGGTFSEGI